MADETEGPNAGAGASGAGVDPAALALAMGATAQNERVAAEAEVFLREQTALVRLQAKELAHELGLRHWSLWVRHTSGLLKLALELFAGLLLLFVVTAIGVMVWNAAHADGLIIESFSVPPDLAARGLTGEVMAAKLLDRIIAMEAQTASQRAPKSYANNWSEQDLKIEIPETGLMVGQVDSFLREKLGHETHVTGEVIHTESGLSLTVRAGTNGGDSVTGGEAQLDGH